NTELLLLARIDYHSAANDEFYLWENQDLSLGELTLGSAGASSVGAFNLAFDRISIRAGTASGGNIGEANFDEIRLGNTFGDVTTIPEPTPVVLIMFSLLAVTSAYRRRMTSETF